MTLPWWTRYDANMYHALSMFPKEQEGKLLSVDEFKGYFKDFYGRPVQDIVEALRRYSQKGYFKYEIILTPEYLQRGKSLAKVADALEKLRSTAPDIYNGLDTQIYAKVMAKQSLTKAEATGLPDDAKEFLQFKLLDIDRYELGKELSGYKNSPTSLEKFDPRTRPAPPKLNLDEIELTPGSYDKSKGVLNLAPFHTRAIADKAGVKRPNGKKYTQCLIMEHVFKSSRMIRNGVEIGTILVINKHLVDKTTTKKMTNAVAAINRKVARDNGLKKLLIMDGKKIKVNASYL
ncbi:MAG TPA: hypothetical protein VFT87_02525 [Candidatus Saccharimonadales bacterium]|nr:hypothetical protein [Candidatus Saccharimonadales bacterium]